MLHVTAGSKTCDARVRSEIYPDTHTLLTVSPFESNGNMMKYVLSRLLIHVEPLSLKLERIVGTMLYGAVELQLPLLGVLAAVCSVVKGRWKFFLLSMTGTHSFRFTPPLHCREEEVVSLSLKLMCRLHSMSVHSFISHVHE